MDLKEAKEIASKYFNEAHKQAEMNMVEMVSDNTLPSFVKTDFLKVLDYNVSGGKKQRGLSLVEFFVLLTPNFELHVLKSAALLGWVVEYMQAFLLMLDDIMDNSDMRRDKICWYKKPEIGLMAINDAFLIKSAMLKVIHQHFSSFESFNSIFEIIIDTLIKTGVGQAMDLKFCKLGSKVITDFSEFTPENYKMLVLYKTTHYSFILPYMAALLLSSIHDKNPYTKVLPLIEEIGYFFQVQDDYLDVYGDPKITGKIGTDIQEGKLTWLIIELLPIISVSDLEHLNKSYGHSDKSHITKVKHLYDKYDIKSKYTTFIENTSFEIVKKLNTIAPPEIASYYIDYITSIKYREK